MTIATYIRLPYLLQISITSVVINNRGNTAIPSSIPEFKVQGKFSPIMYLIARRSSRSDSLSIDNQTLKHGNVSQRRPRLQNMLP